MEGVRGGLDVDPCAVWEHEAQIGASLELEELTELGEERRQGRVRRCRRVALPDGLDELVSSSTPRPVEHEVAEQEPPLPPPETSLDAPTLDLGGEVSTEVDTRRQGRAKVTTRNELQTLCMANILVNVTNGPEHPTRAALAFLVARSAQDAGHEVSLFLAGDAVQLLRESVLDSLVGLGTGSLRESYDALCAGNARWYVSAMSSKARGLEPNGVAEAALPSKLVELSLEADSVLTY